MKIVLPSGEQIFIKIHKYACLACVCPLNVKILLQLRREHPRHQIRILPHIFKGHYRV